METAHHDPLAPPVLRPANCSATYGTPPESKNQTCGICHSAFSEDASIVSHDGCKNSFCVDCLLRWHSTQSVARCPTCRGDLGAIGGPGVNPFKRQFVLADGGLDEVLRRVGGARFKSVPLIQRYFRRVRLLDLHRFQSTFHRITAPSTFGLPAQPYSHKQAEKVINNALVISNMSLCEIPEDYINQVVDRLIIIDEDYIRAAHKNEVDFIVRKYWRKWREELGVRFADEYVFVESPETSFLVPVLPTIRVFQTFDQLSTHIYLRQGHVPKDSILANAPARWLERPRLLSSELRTLLDPSDQVSLRNIDTIDHPAFGGHHAEIHWALYRPADDCDNIAYAAPRVIFVGPHKVNGGIGVDIPENRCIRGFLVSDDEGGLAFRTRHAPPHPKEKHTKEALKDVNRPLWDYAKQNRDDESKDGFLRSLSLKALKSSDDRNFQPLAQLLQPPATPRDEPILIEDDESSED